MRALVCGGRNYNDRDRLFAVLDAIHFETEIDVVIHGAARGADLLAEAWAKEREVSYMGVPAKWSMGRGAGPARNHMMLKRGAPDIVIAFPGGSGTDNMVEQAVREGIEIIDLRFMSTAE